ncbi:hypothetical protein [Mesorhizobium sp.]|uniref:hypothetical protein n=1 Tax=Mesorhizobium sp. TaxID=1871066 RepID=UPI0025C1F14A|nr:hypothetical protein [Mesorhizobium sp.]
MAPPEAILTAPEHDNTIVGVIDMSKAKLRLFCIAHARLMAGLLHRGSRNRSPGAGEGWSVPASRDTSRGRKDGAHRAGKSLWDALAFPRCGIAYLAIDKGLGPGG